MSHVLIKFKKINRICIGKIMREKFIYDLNKFEEDTGRDSFTFSAQEFLYRANTDCFGGLDLEGVVQKIAGEILQGYDFVVDVEISWEQVIDRYTIEIRGEADHFGSYGNRFYGGFIDEGWNLTYDPEPLRKIDEGWNLTFDAKPLKRYFENDIDAVVDAHKRDTNHLRIPKTFTVYSGYSRDGRLRTIIHWEDGIKTDVYLKPDDFDDIYLAIAYCYVKRKFGNMSHFRRIVERNTKEVTGGVKRFIYGGDSTLLMTAVNMYNIYDQVALYLAISYLGDTDQWVSKEDLKRLEDSVNE
jgi:hypothetical protein